MDIDRTVRDWLVYFDLAESLEEADILCELGKVRLNGVTCSNSYLAPYAGDTLITTDNDYTYQVPATALSS